MGTTKVACALFGTAFFGLVVVATLGTACGGKSHVEVDILGDAAVIGPPGTQTCGFCGSNSVCIMNQCATQCQNDHECAAGHRCLRTSQGGGCVNSTETDCSACTQSGTVCTNGECRTQCSSICASDQSCRGVACYGNDPQHDPSGSNASTTTNPGTTFGAGGSTGVGGGGQGGSNVGQCGFLTESCSRCMCTSCPSDWQACNNDRGCMSIGECISRTGCRDNCYRPEFCQGVIDSYGGPGGPSYGRVSALGTCASGPCIGSCGSTGPGFDSGMPPPSAGWWRFDEGSGPFSADASGNGHPANLVNSPLWKPGITGSAIELDGSSQFASLSPGPIIGSTPNFTIEAWVNWPGASGTQMIYCESAFTDVIDLYLENGVPSFSIVSGGSQPVTGTTSVTTSKWHQLAAVLQPGIGASLYLDGQILRTNPMVGPAAPNIFETNIGRSGASGGSRYFRGIIDEVRVFNSARSPGEIANDYKSYITGGP